MIYYLILISIYSSISSIILYTVVHGFCSAGRFPQCKLCSNYFADLYAKGILSRFPNKKKLSPFLVYLIFNLLLNLSQ